MQSLFLTAAYLEVLSIQTFGNASPEKKQTYAVGEGNEGLMRLLSDAFLCLLCSSLSLARYLAYKPQGNRLSQSKF